MTLPITGVIPQLTRPVEVAWNRVQRKCVAGKIALSRSQADDEEFKLVYRSRNGSELAFPKSEPTKPEVQLLLLLATAFPLRGKNVCKLGMVASAQHASTGEGEAGGTLQV